LAIIEVAAQFQRANDMMGMNGLEQPGVKPIDWFVTAFSLATWPKAR